MRLSRHLGQLAILAVIALLAIAISPMVISTASSDASFTIEQTGAVGEPIPGMAESQRLLAWVAPGNRPGNQTAGTPGELVYFNPDGSTESILALPQGTTRVTECGPNGTSPDGSVFAFIVTVTGGGEETGTIYLLNGASSELTTIASGLNPASCVGSTPFQFSPDGSRFAYIEWSLGATNQISPFGFLRIYDTASASQVASFENVTSFDLTNTGAVWVNFFPNDDGEATEVAITTWDGNADIEVSSLVADEENDCYYNSASTTEVSTGLLAIMGYRCNRGAVTTTQWQLFNIDPTNRTAQLEQTDTAAGRYFVFSQTNALFPSPDGNNVFFTLPDGISNQTVGLYTTAIDNVAPTQLIDRSAVMPSVSDLPYDANNATALLSPNGQYLSLVVNTPNNDATLYVYDLSDPALLPITIDAGDTGDTIGAMVFNASSSSLYYVAGSDQGGNNSLFALDLNTGTESRIRRGRYAQVAISPDGSTLAAMNWVEFDAEEPRYLTLEVIDIASTAQTAIYVGGEVDEEGKLINQSFAYPVAWR
ncbi:MAG: hypothetical protein WBC91_09675 [Phototrophicaceae bacterium]